MVKEWKCSASIYNHGRTRELAGGRVWWLWSARTSPALVELVQSTVQSNKRTKQPNQLYATIILFCICSSNTAKFLLHICIQSIFPNYYIFLFIYPFFNFRYCGIAYIVLKIFLRLHYIVAGYLLLSRAWSDETRGTITIVVVEFNRKQSTFEHEMRCRYTKVWAARL